MATKVTVRLSDGRLYERPFEHRSDAEAWADRTLSMGMNVVSIASDDEARDSEGAPVATCLSEQVQQHSA